MKFVTLSRRQVLRGSGGLALGLPLLPSLLPGRGYGVAYAAAPQKRFVALATQHGAVAPESMVPAASMLTQTMSLYPNHDIKHGPLVPTMEGGNTRLSAVLSAPSGTFTPRLVGKMNVLRGFDIPYYIGHQTGGHLGNFVRSDQGPKNLQPFVTIDQLMAYSPSFFPNVTGIKERSITTGLNFHGISFTYSNPQARSGVQKTDVTTSAPTLFDRLFNGAGGSSTPATPARKPIVDRLLKNYQSLRQSNRRLSAEDRRRLDDHIARIAELERKVTATGSAPTKSCSGFSKPGAVSIADDNPGAAEARRRHQVLNDVIAMAFACGTSRIATINVMYPFYDVQGSWHQDVAHQWQVPAKQAMLVQGAQRTFEGAILDLAAKLDAIEDAPGQTVLDQTLLQWTQESGWSTHDAQDMTIVTFGSAAGYFKTGQFVDYRATNNPRAHLDIFSLQKQFCGLWHRQWLATALQAMGIARAEFEKNGKTGYGDPFYDGSYPRAVHANVIDRASDPIAVVTNA